MINKRFPYPEAPCEPAHGVDSPHGDVERHVPSVVEPDKGHGVDVVEEERQAHGGCQRPVEKVPLGDEAQEEGEQREHHHGEGAEVVHALGELKVSSKKKGALLNRLF